LVESKQYSLKPATFFLVTGLLLGILYCVIVPYGAGFDEERHMVRIYRISHYLFMPNFPDLPAHKEIFDLSYQRRLSQSPASDMFSQENFTNRFSKLDADIRYGVKTNSIYAPIMFLPQALVARFLWWKFDLPILPVIILQKIAGVLLYIAGAYAAIRAVPYGKWIFVVLALSPAALYQAATLNADGFTNAASFAFIGWTIAVYLDERSGIQPRSVWILSGLALLLGVSKPGAIILLPLLFILWRHPFPSKKWIVILGMGILLAIIANVGWSLIATQGSSVFTGGTTESVSGQSGLIMADPISFIKLLLQGMFLSIPSQIQGWVAAYGYWAGKVPGPVYFFWALCLAAAFFCEPRPIQIPVRTRIFMMLFFFFCSAVIFTLAFSANYVIGGVLALAKHGRYYIPFAPLFFLGFAGLFTVPAGRQRQAQWVMIGSYLFATIWFCFGIYTTYYTYCDYDSYMGAKCTLPIYKNLEKEAGSTVGLNAGEQLKQTFTNECGDLEVVSVYVKSIPASLTGSLMFSLLDENQQTLVSQNYAVREIPAEDYLELPVQLPAGYQSKDFEIELKALELAPFEKFVFSVNSTDIYRGRLSADGLTGVANLLIHYTCASP